MIKVKNIKKSYLNNHVINDVSIDIPKGKLVTLLGINGSGKSTLLRLISGNELPDSGDSVYKDENLTKLNFSYVNEIGFIDENINFVSSFSFYEFCVKLSKNIKNWDQEKFDRMLKDRKIDSSKAFQSYSRGQKMQLALIMKLCMNPKVLLLDEITSVLDAYARKYFLEELRNYVDEGNTVVITTNIVNELEFFTDELIILKDGNIVLNEKVSDISKKYIKIRKKRGTEHPVFEDKSCLWSGTNSDFSTSYIIKSETALKYELSEDFIDRRASTMEDVFIYYFSDLEERQ
jgi:ABC-2 type transport system ATP-binding protein